MNKKLTINNEDLLLSDKQLRHTKVNVTGKVFVDVYNINSKDELLSTKKEYWLSKGYEIINDISMTDSEYSYKDLLARKRIYVKNNHPKAYIIYTNKLDANQIALIKFLLTHGVTVCIEDRILGIKKIYQPICDLFNVDLFRLTKVELLTKEIIASFIPEIQQQAKHKQEILGKARAQYYKDNINEQLNELLEDITNALKLDKIESTWEDYIWATRYATRDLLVDIHRESLSNPEMESIMPTVNNRAIRLYDLDNPQVLTALKQIIRTWAPVFDINIRLDNTESHCYDIIKPTGKQMTYAGSEGYYYIGNDLMYSDPTETRYITEEQARQAAIRQKAKFLFRVKKNQSADSYLDIINAYIQIEYYKKHLNDFFPADTHYLCSCGMPNSLHAEYCSYCGCENPNKLPEETSYEMLEYKLNKVEE